MEVLEPRHHGLPPLPTTKPEPVTTPSPSFRSAFRRQDFTPQPRRPLHLYSSRRLRNDREVFHLEQANTRLREQLKRLNISLNEAVANFSPMRPSKPVSSQEMWGVIQQRLKIGQQDRASLEWQLQRSNPERLPGLIQQVAQLSEQARQLELANTQAANRLAKEAAKEGHTHKDSLNNSTDWLHLLQEKSHYQAKVAEVEKQTETHRELLLKKSNELHSLQQTHVKLMNTARNRGVTPELVEKTDALLANHQQKLYTHQTVQRAAGADLRTLAMREASLQQQLQMNNQTSAQLAADLQAKQIELQQLQAELKTLQAKLYGTPMHSLVAALPISASHEEVSLHKPIPQPMVREFKLRKAPWRSPSTIAPAAVATNPAKANSVPIRSYSIRAPRMAA